MYNPEKSYDPSAPTLTEPLGQHGDIHEAVNAMGVEVVDDTPPPLDPVKPESLTLKYETKAPRVPLIMSSFVMWAGIICFALSRNEATWLVGIFFTAVGALGYAISVFSSKITKSIYSLSNNFSMNDISTYIESVKNGRDNVGVSVVCYHYSKNLHHNHNNGTRGSTRTQSRTKNVTFRETLDWRNGIFYDRSPISGESIQQLTDNINTDRISSAFIQFNTKVSYNLTPEAERDYMAFYGTMHSQYSRRDDHIDITKVMVNAAVQEHLLVSVKGRSNATQQFIMSATGHAIFALCGIFAFYEVYYSTQTAVCTLPFVKEVHYNANAVEAQPYTEAAPIPPARLSRKTEEG